MLTKRILLKVICALLCAQAPGLGQKPEAILQTGHGDDVLAVAFSPDGRLIASAGRDNLVKIWAASSGVELRTLSGIPPVAFSAGGTLAYGDTGGRIVLYDPVAGIELRSIKAGNFVDFAFSPDGRTLATVATDIRLWSAETGVVLKSWGEGVRGETGAIPPDSLLTVKDSRQPYSPNAVAFSPDGKTLASTSINNTVRLWEIGDVAKPRTLAGQPPLVFSPDGEVLATRSRNKQLKLWDVASGSALRTFTPHSDIINSLAFSPDGRFLASGDQNKNVWLWEVSTGSPKTKLQGHTAPVNAIAFSPVGGILATGGDDDAFKLWDVKAGRELRPDGGAGTQDWLVVTPDGLFDGGLEAWDRIRWRHGREAFDVAPVETFLDEFYHQNLLGEILEGRKPRSAWDAAERESRLPRLNLSLAEDSSSATGGARRARVKIEIAAASAGARDVRLLRNGSTVKIWRGDDLRGKKSGAVLEATIPLVPGENLLSAYAFNEDHLKGPSSTLSVKGGAASRKGTAYIFAVGINRYAGAEFKNMFAVADAQAFGEALKEAQGRLGSYAEVRLVYLLDEQATKANILLGLQRLANDAPDAPLPAGAPPAFDLLRPAQPEDAVFVFFAGQATAQDNRYYFIPYDTGLKEGQKTYDKEGMKALISRGVSDDDLSKVFERLDAGLTLLVLDTCNSGQVLELGKRDGGLVGTKRLAQLAYEKGIYVLASSQSDQLSIELGRLQHGLLTYVLVEEGLKKGAADQALEDGILTLQEWLEYAAFRVPQHLQEDTSSLSREISIEEVYTKPAPRSFQRPRVFYRRSSEARSFIISKDVKKMPLKEATEGLTR